MKLLYNNQHVNTRKEKYAKNQRPARQSPFLTNIHDLPFIQVSAVVVAYVHDGPCHSVLNTVCVKKMDTFDFCFVPQRFFTGDG